jgi:putative transcriptional regulator
MIRFRLTELIADAQFKSGKRITMLEVSEATGINRMTLSRMANVRGYSTSTETIDKLCRYFKCQVGDIANYIEDEPLPAVPVPSPVEASDVKGGNPRPAGRKPAPTSRKAK